MEMHKLVNVQRMKDFGLFGPEWDIYITTYSSPKMQYSLRKMERKDCNDHPKPDRIPAWRRRVGMKTHP